MALLGLRSAAEVSDAARTGQKASALNWVSAEAPPFLIGQVGSGLAAGPMSVSPRAGRLARGGG